MLKPEMIEKLNEQMNLELYSSLLYQQMSAWCSYHTFEGAAAFLRRHAQEEMTHMQRLFDYLTDTAPADQHRKHRDNGFSHTAEYSRRAVGERQQKEKQSNRSSVDRSKFDRFRHIHKDPKQDRNPDKKTDSYKLRHRH